MNVDDTVAKLMRREIAMDDVLAMVKAERARRQARRWISIATLLSLALMWAVLFLQAGAA